jgi:acyl-CoA synthetase (AMP-forming)/AMP-acid ligase II
MEAVLQQMDRYLARHGVSREHPIALECSQTLAGAVALLHTLSRSYGVVLLPDLSARAKEAGSPRFVPSFCSHVIQTGASSGLSLGTAIECVANPAFRPDPHVSSATRSDFYLRTSGSTGMAKLARMSHQQWLNNAAACVERWGLTTEDRFSVPVPIFHSYGFGAAFLPGLLVGASMDLLRDGNIIKYLEREERFKPNVAFLTPAMCDIFVARRKAPRTYRLTVTAGDKVKRDTVAGFDARFGPLLNLYGSAEMGAVSTPSPADPLEARIGTAGYPLAGIEFRVGDAESASGSAGEQAAGILHCRQKNGLSGYLLQDYGWRFEPRAEDAWFAMGDVARVRGDGYVEILGRFGLSVKRDGLLVVFNDLEATLETIDGVQRAVVIAAGESRRGSRLVAVCVAEGPDAALPVDTIRRRCQELLPIYAVPDDIVVVGALPQLPSGKVDRRALQESFSGCI